jgi:hypothetical protein
MCPSFQKDVSLLSDELVRELQGHSCLCFYPSCGTDVSDLDYFASGRLPLAERVDSGQAAHVPDKTSDLFAHHPTRPDHLVDPGSTDETPCSATSSLGPRLDPDAFLHTDVTFFQEYAAGADLPLRECGLHGLGEVLAFRELAPLTNPNRIYGNFEHSGRCFVYKLRLWGSPQPKTLVYLLCENEAFVTDVLLAHGLAVPIVWSKSWNGGHTYGTWLANVLDRLQTKEMFTDWLCVPGHRGQPPNRRVAEAYPELMGPAKVKLVRNEAVHWVDEGSHGWVEEFSVRPK